MASACSLTVDSSHLPCRLWRNLYWVLVEPHGVGCAVALAVAYRHFARVCIPAEPAGELERAGLLGHDAICQPQQRLTGLEEYRVCQVSLCLNDLLAVPIKQAHIAPPMLTSAASMWCTWPRILTCSTQAT